MNQAQSYFLRGSVAHLHDRTKKTLQRSSWQKDAGETGELTSNTSIPSLKGYKFDIKLGLDKETGMPYAGASVSYDFYDYKLKLKHGEVSLKGNLTVTNVFSPTIDGVFCNALAKAGKAVDFVSEHRPEIATAFLGAGALLDAKLIYATAAGFLSSSPMLQAQMNARQDYTKRLPAYSQDRLIAVTFDGYSLEMKGEK